MSIKIIEYANLLANVKMYPLFDVAFYAMICIDIRKKNIQGDIKFLNEHPLASFAASLLLCFSGSILANFLINEPISNLLKRHDEILLIAIIWYLVNYSPMDIIFKLAKIPILNMIVLSMANIFIVNSVNKGVSYGVKHFPKFYIFCIILGTFKGAGFHLLSFGSQYICGSWNPMSHEIMKPSSTTKICFIISTVFLLQKLGIITIQYSLLFSAIVIYLIHLEISNALFGPYDPFLAMENVLCYIFFTRWVNFKKSNQECVIDDLHLN